MASNIYLSSDEDEDSPIIRRDRRRVVLEYRIPTQVERKRLILSDIPVHCYSNATRVDISSIIEKATAYDQGILENMTLGTSKTISDTVTPRCTVGDLLNSPRPIFVSAHVGSDSRYVGIQFVFHLYNKRSNSSNSNEIVKRRKQSSINSNVDRSGNINAISNTSSNHDDHFYRNTKGAILWKDTPYEDNNIPKTLSSHIKRYDYIVRKIKDGQRLGLDKVSSVTRTGVSWGCWYTENRYLCKLNGLRQADSKFSELIEDPITQWTDWIKAVDDYTKASKKK